MKIKQSLLAGLASLVAVLGLSVGMATPASAAPGCFSGRLCLWDGANYSGSVISLTLPGPGGCVTLPTSPYWKNIASSFFNNSARGLIFYDGDGCTGSSLVATGAYWYNNIDSVNDNRTNSIYVYY
jgi:hypothetical protein